ncbi:MAG: hypothetical protein JWP67_2680, partial [Mucilaginibacter sp.]|nr:hypothetical protein [Mucilaginibacter sp.]
VDHKIDIPRLVFRNIAESIKMNVSATYTAASKPNPNNKLP